MTDKTPVSLAELLKRVRNARPVNAAPAKKDEIDPELLQEIDALRAEFVAKETPFTEGALIGMAENRLLHRRFDEQAAERFAQVAAIPQRFAKATLAGFVAFDGVQQDAFMRVCDWACEVKAGKSPWLVLSGTWGTGKSHLACAALNSLRDAKGLDVRFVACIDLIRAVQDTYKNKDGASEAKIISDLARLDVLCLDDVAADPSPFEAKLLARILDARYRNDLPTLIVTNLGFKDRKFDEYVGPLVASRIRECADYVDCTTTDFRRDLKERKNALRCMESIEGVI